MEHNHAATTHQWQTRVDLIPLESPELVPALECYLRLVTTATEVRARAMAAFAAALEPLVPTVVHLLAVDIRFNREEGRGCLAYLLRVIPLLCREAWQLWRNEDAA